MCAKIIIKRTKDLNYFSLCALNLFNTRVSQFENFSMAFKFIDMHLYIYIYIYSVWVKMIDISFMPKIIRILRSCTFCRFHTVNIST